MAARAATRPAPRRDFRTYPHPRLPPTVTLPVVYRANATHEAEWDVVRCGDVVPWAETAMDSAGGDAVAASELTAGILAPEDVEHIVAPAVDEGGDEPAVVAVVDGLIRLHGFGQRVPFPYLSLVMTEYRVMEVDTTGVLHDEGVVLVARVGARPTHDHPQDADRPPPAAFAFPLDDALQAAVHRRIVTPEKTPSPETLLATLKHQESALVRDAEAAAGRRLVAAHLWPYINQARPADHRFANSRATRGRDTVFMRRVRTSRAAFDPVPPARIPAAALLPFFWDLTNAGMSIEAVLEEIDKGLRVLAERKP